MAYSSAVAEFCLRTPMTSNAMIHHLILMISVARPMTGLDQTELLDKCRDPSFEYPSYIGDHDCQFAFGSREETTEHFCGNCSLDDSFQLELSAHVLAPIQSN